MVPVSYYLILSAILFSIGLARFLVKAQHHHRLHVD